jgi:hypothetical protein
MMPDSLAPDVAEQLLDLREPDGGQYAAVTDLLVAAAGPALPAELTGEDSALRTFRLAYRSRRRRRAGLFAGVAVALLSLGGTAYAASGDHLPDPVQRTVESLLGGGATTPAATPARGGTPTASPVPSPTGGPASRIEDLCRAWEAARADPHAPQVTGEDRRILARAAKSETGIGDYCRGVLGPPSTTASPAAPATSQPGTAKPGGGKPGGGKPSTIKPGTADPGGSLSRTHPVRPYQS